MGAIKEITRIHPESGRVYLRNGINLAFFIEQPVHEISEAVTELLERFVQNVPQNKLKWAVTSATSEEWVETDANTIPRFKAALAPAGARKRKLTAFRLNDSGADAPGYSFRLLGKPMDQDWPDAVTHIQMTFPLDVIEDEQLAKFVSQIQEFAILVSPVSGYCSPALQYSELHIEEAFYDIRGIAKIHPGYDVQVNEMTYLDIDKKVRGARWISFLGAELVDVLGGTEVLKQTLRQPITIESVGGGLMIRAGEFPEIGDVNRRVDTPLLKAVAKLLEPITLFGEVDLLSYFADFDDDILRQWERRFLD